jgi:hypothetical protein
MGRWCMLPRQLVTPSSSFESTHTLTSSLTSRHTLCLFHSCLLLLLLLLLLVPLCSMLYAGLHVCRCVATCSIAGSSPL